MWRGRRARVTVGGGGRTAGCGWPGRVEGVVDVGLDTHRKCSWKGCLSGRVRITHVKQTNEGFFFLYRGEKGDGIEEGKVTRQVVIRNPMSQESWG